jgi:hypothetical protein
MLTINKVPSLPKKIAYNLNRISGGKVKLVAASSSYLVNCADKVDQEKIIDSIFFRLPSNPRTTVRYAEFIISPPKTLTLKNDNCVKSLCDQYLLRMLDTEELPLYVAYCHFDTDTTHYHIITSLLKRDGSKFETSFIKRRSTRVTAELLKTREFQNLFNEHFSDDKLVGVYNYRYRKRKAYYSDQRFEKSGRVDVMRYLQEVIYDTYSERPTLEELLVICLSRGIEIEFTVLPTKFIGVTYTVKADQVAMDFAGQIFSEQNRNCFPIIDRDYHFSGSSLGTDFVFKTLCNKLSDLNTKNTLFKKIVKDKSGRDNAGREVIKSRKLSNNSCYPNEIEFELRRQAVRLRVLHFVNKGQIKNAFKATQDENYVCFTGGEIEEMPLATLVSFISLDAFTQLQKENSKWDLSMLEIKIFLREREEMEAGLNSILRCVANKTKDKKKLIGILMNAPSDFKKMFANSALKLAGIKDSIHVSEYAPNNHHLLQFCHNFTQIDLSLFAVADDMFLTWKAKTEHLNYVHPAFRGIEVTRGNGIEPSRGMSR